MRITWLRSVSAMKVWFDTEFLEDGKTIELISIGMVREDGVDYYAVNADMDWLRILKHDWLVENVVPQLPLLKWGTSLDLNHPDVKPHSVIKEEVGLFLLDAAIASGADSELELWSWYGAYDHVALCQLWGPMIAKPSFIPHYTNDIRQEFQRWGNPHHNIPENNHNALDDAYYHKKLHDFIAQIGKDRYREAVLEALHPEIGYWCDLDNLHKEKN